MDTIAWRDNTVSLLDDIASAMDRFGYEASASRARNWSQQLRQSRYHVAFTGMIKAGKSTLLNALLERELFPVGPVPLTPAITAYVRDEERARIVWQEEGQPGRILLDEPDAEAERVYEILDGQFNALNAKYAEDLSISLADRDEVARRSSDLPLVTVDIRYPLGPDLEGIVLVDTPGTGDLSQARVEVLLHYLPNADAAVVILNATQPLNKDAAAFIREQLWDKGVRQLFFVLNKFDLLNTTTDQQEALEYVRAMLSEQLGEAPRLYPLSGYLALRGIQWRDGLVDWQAVCREDRKMRLYDTPDELLTESGIQPFCEALWGFLEGTGRIASQVRFTLDKTKMELDVLQGEMDITERLLAGRPMPADALMRDADDQETSHVVDAVQLIAELGERAEQAKQSLQTIDDGKQAVRSYLATVRRERLSNLPVLVGDLNEDPHYQAMRSNLHTVIEANRLRDLVGTEDDEGILSRQAKLELNTWSRGMLQEMSVFVGQVAGETLSLAEDSIRETMREVESTLGRNMPMTADMGVLVGAQSVPSGLRAFVTGGKGWGKFAAANLGMATAMLFVGFLAPVSILLAGFSAAMSLSRGWRQASVGRKQDLEGQLLAQINKEARSHRSKLEEKTIEVLESLESSLLERMDAKCAEIETLLARYQAEGADARRTVQKKRQWLAAFRPEMGALMGRWHTVVGQAERSG